MMKQIILILISFTLVMCASKEEKQRRVVENYLKTIFKTDDKNMEEIFSLLKFTKPPSEEEKEEYIGAFKFLKYSLKGKNYKILNFQETVDFLKQKKNAPFPIDSDRGTIFYIYNVDEDQLLWPTATVVDDNYDIICIGIKICSYPKRLCLWYH